MRTTLDLPTSLIRLLKQRAEQEGVPMKTVYNRALARAFGVNYAVPAANRARPSKSRN